MIKAVSGFLGPRWRVRGRRILVLVFRDPRLLERHPYHGWTQPHSPSRSWRQIGR